jgi:hypothetical protein
MQQKCHVFVHFLSALLLTVGIDVRLYELDVKILYA